MPPNPTFLFSQTLIGSKICLVLWEDVLVESCGGKQPTSLIIRVGAADGGWGRELRVSRYSSGQVEGRSVGVCQEPEMRGTAEHISAVKWTSLGGAQCAAAMPAVVIVTMLVEHRCVPGECRALRIQKLSHLIFIPTSNVGDTDPTIL